MSNVNPITRVASNARRLSLRVTRALYRLPRLVETVRLGQFRRVTTYGVAGTIGRTVR